MLSLFKKKKINVVFDTDPGVDDAVAIAIALNSDIFDVKLFSTVSGNVDVDITTRNTKFLLKTFNKEYIPIAKGANKPLMREPIFASEVHGTTGLGNFPVNMKINPKIKETAVEDLYKVICRYTKKIILYVIGPQTNIAQLILKHPDVKFKIKQIVFMGGSVLGVGNIKPWGEFNAFVDPEAMDIVLKSGISMVMIPVELGIKAIFNENQLNKMEYHGNTGKLFKEMMMGYKEINSLQVLAQSHDPCAVFYTLKPSVFKTKQAYVSVDLYNTPGKTYVRFNKHGPVKVVIDVKKAKFYKLFFKRLSMIKN